MSLDVETTTLRQRREAIVLEHAEAESACDVERTLATFHHPRYEVKPFGKPHDGAEAVRAATNDSVELACVDQGYTGE